MNLKNKRALVTGGSLGIGKAIAQKLVEKGAKVAITGRNEGRLQETANRINAFPIKADVSKEADVLDTYKLFLDQFNGLDILVNNAGLGRGWDEIDQVNMDDFRYVFGVNVFGAAMMAKEAARIFRKQSSGNIVNIASTVAVKGYPTGTIYAASKFALRGMTECWRSELRKDNVRVFLVNPSEVTTAFRSPEGIERSEEPNKLRAEEVAHAVISILEMDDRGFIPELNIWATNPF